MNFPRKFVAFGDFFDVRIIKNYSERLLIGAI